MKVRRLLALACALVLALSLAPGAAAWEYADLPDSHWAHEDMEEAAELHLLWGTGNGLMQPEAGLTWAQCLTLAARTFAPEAFADPANYDPSWELLAYNACRAAGLLLLPEEEFLPVAADPAVLSQWVSRQDTLVLLDRALPESVTGERREWVTDPATGEETYQVRTADEALADLWQVPVTHLDAVRRLYGLGVVNGTAVTGWDGVEYRFLYGADALRRCDGAALFLRALEELDDESYGEKKTVTLHVTDEFGQSLVPDLTVDTAVGRRVAWVAYDALSDDPALHFYERCDDDLEISTACDDYTIVYRPMTQTERARREFWDAVERGEALAEDEWKQDYHRYELGDSSYKHLLLFGSPDTYRYADQADSKAHMTTVTVPMWKLDKKGNKYASQGSFSINAALADDVVAIFTEIFNDPEQFPFNSIGGFGWRGDSSRSEHNCGTAIDISPTQNYQVRDGNAMVGTHWTPGADPYSIPVDGSVVRIFRKYGWDWGGDAWAGHADPTVGYHDYMHFSYMGT